MSQRSLAKLSRRERQLLDVLYQHGEASVADIRKALPDPPSYSAVRALMGVLEEKGLARHRREGRAYLYSPSIPRDEASRSALRHLVRTFFDNSVEDVVAALVDLKSSRMTDEEYVRLLALIQEKRQQEDE